MTLPAEPGVSPAVRLIHFSDIHLSTRPLGWRLSDCWTKRVTGWLNLHALGRARTFEVADRLVQALMTEVRERRPDRVIFSGDATALGFEAEMRKAATLLGLTEGDMLPGLAVPGNHDYYTPGAAASKLFEHYFAPWQVGDRVDGEVYPFAQRVGPLWLVGVNSCTGNRWITDAAGSVGREQLARLDQLLPSLTPGPRILVTHYPVCMANGQPERRHRGLRDLSEVVRVAERGGVCLWLHGHRHTAYHHACSSFASFPIVCAGTATQAGRWSYGLYTIAGRQFSAARRAYSPERGRFEECQTFRLELPAR
jgi:3',5'-cyclic AMP phosphodiesterase CpdA